MKTKKCTKHNVYFPDEIESFPATEGYFGRNPYTPDRLDNWCRRCIIIASSQKLPTPLDNKEEQEMGGFVYFAKKWGLVKIGCCVTPVEARIKKLKTSHPRDEMPELLHSIPTNDRYKLEREYHDYFADKRIGGEWFDLTDKDIENLKGTE